MKIGIERRRDRERMKETVTTDKYTLEIVCVDRIGDTQSDRQDRLDRLEPVRKREIKRGREREKGTSSLRRATSELLEDRYTKRKKPSVWPWEREKKNEKKRKEKV